LAGREFNEFHILIKDKEPGRYDIEATLLSRTSENKIDHDFETANAEFKFDEYKILISRVEFELSGKKGERGVQEIRDDYREKLGKFLYTFLFSGKLDKFFQDAFKTSMNDNKTGLRIRLQVCSPELVNVAWEFAYENKLPLGFLSVHPRTPMSRFLGDAQELKRMMSSNEINREIEYLTAKLLLVYANPYGAPDIKPVEERVKFVKEINRFADPLIAIQPDWPDPPCWDCVKDKLRDGFNILHIYSHGEFDGDLVKIILTGPKGEKDSIEPNTLKELFTSPDCDNLFLVFLSACESSLVSEDKPTSGLAYSLISSLTRIQMVIAMQYKINIPPAQYFAINVYKEISRGHGIDEAVQAGRNSLLFDLHDWRNSSHFAIPVVFTKPTGGNTFTWLVSVQEPLRMSGFHDKVRSISQKYNELKISQSIEVDTTLDTTVQFWEGKRMLSEKLVLIYRNVAELGMQDQTVTLSKNINEGKKMIAKIKSYRADPDFENKELRNRIDQIIAFYGEVIQYLLHLIEKNEPKFLNLRSRSMRTAELDNKINCTLKFYDNFGKLNYFSNGVKRLVKVKNDGGDVEIAAEAYQVPITEFKNKFEAWSLDIEGLPEVKNDEILQKKITEIHASICKNIEGLENGFYLRDLNFETLSKFMKNIDGDFKNLWTTTIPALVGGRSAVE
jgi:hypothetical protein